MDICLSKDAEIPSNPDRKADSSILLQADGTICSPGEGGETP